MEKEILKNSSNNQCNGPKAFVCLAGLRNDDKASVDGTEKVREKNNKSSDQRLK